MLWKSLTQFFCILFLPRRGLICKGFQNDYSCIQLCSEFGGNRFSSFISSAVYIYERTYRQAFGKKHIFEVRGPLTDISTKIWISIFTFTILSLYYSTWESKNLLFSCLIYDYWNLTHFWKLFMKIRIFISYLYSFFSLQVR